MSIVSPLETLDALNPYFVCTSASTSPVRPVPTLFSSSHSRIACLSRLRVDLFECVFCGDNRHRTATITSPWICIRTAIAIIMSCLPVLTDNASQEINVSALYLYDHWLGLALDSHFKNLVCSQYWCWWGVTSSAPVLALKEYSAGRPLLPTFGIVLGCAWPLTIAPIPGCEPRLYWHFVSGDSEGPPTRVIRTGRKQ